MRIRYEVEQATRIHVTIYLKVPHLLSLNLDLTLTPTPTLTPMLTPRTLALSNLEPQHTAAVGGTAVARLGLFAVALEVVVERELLVLANCLGGEDPDALLPEWWDGPLLHNAVRVA